MSLLASSMQMPRMDFSASYMLDCPEAKQLSHKYRVLNGPAGEQMMLIPTRSQVLLAVYPTLAG